MNPFSSQASEVGTPDVRSRSLQQTRSSPPQESSLDLLAASSANLLFKLPAPPSPILEASPRWQSNLWTHLQNQFLLWQVNSSGYYFHLQYYFLQCNFKIIINTVYDSYVNPFPWSQVSLLSLCLMLRLLQHTRPCPLSLHDLSFSIWPASPVSLTLRTPCPPSGITVTKSSKAQSDSGTHLYRQGC